MSTADVRIVDVIDKCHGGLSPLATGACTGINGRHSRRKVMAQSFGVDIQAILTSQRMQRLPMTVLGAAEGASA